MDDATDGADHELERRRAVTLGQTPTMRRFRAELFATVFVTGGCVILIEILGTRVIGREAERPPSPALEARTHGTRGHGPAPW